MVGYVVVSIEEEFERLTIGSLERNDMGLVEGLIEGYIVWLTKGVVVGLLIWLIEVISEELPVGSIEGKLVGGTVFEADSSFNRQSQ